jgi:predicted dehydrogenase
MLPSKFPNRRNFHKALSLGIAAGATARATGSTVASVAEPRSLGLAVVGLGELTTKHLVPAIRQSRACHLAAIVSGSRDKADAWGQRWHVAPSQRYGYGGFDAIVDDTAVDAVYLALPTRMQEEFALRAARAGKHVLCGTPMAHSSESAARMLAACRQAGRQLVVLNWEGARKGTLEAIQRLRQHSAGAEQSLTAALSFALGDERVWRLRQDMAGGGALLSLGIPFLQAARAVAGEEPVSVTAQETKRHPRTFAEVDETMTWALNFPGGLVARGIVSLSVERLNCLQWTSDRVQGHFPDAFALRSAGTTRAGADLAADGLREVAMEFDRWSLHLQTPAADWQSAEAGLRDLRIIEAIYASAEQGRTLAIASSCGLA